MQNSRQCNQVYEEFKDNSIQMGDFFEVYPIAGKKYKKPINRTTYDIVPEESSDIANSFVNITLPTLLEDSFHLTLEQKMFKPFPNKCVYRYFIRSLNGEFFTYNGGKANHVELSHGDEIIIGHNIIKFLKKSTIESTSSIEVNENVCQSNLPILIEGETGTGKTYLAHEIHKKSKRVGDFIHVNLSAFNHNLVESELFGHVKGSFTGAIADKKGAIERANYGTLFIDEIDSCPIELQVKLLLFLDDYFVTPVGGVRPKKINCRLIFSSGRSLKQLVAEKVIRQDFFHRVCSGQFLSLPSLQKNPEKIEKFCHDYLLSHKCSLSLELVRFYQTLAWPGNFRQLKGHLDKKMVLSKSSKLVYDKTDECLLFNKKKSKGVDLEDIYTLKDLRHQYSKAIYYKLNQDVKLAAKALGISGQCLKNYIKPTSP